MLQYSVKKIWENASEFWAGVMSAWAMYHYKPVEQKVTTSSTDFLLWMDSNIRIDGKPVHWRKPIEQGLMYVSQLYCDGKFITHEEASRYGLSVMEFNSLKCAIPREYREQIQEGVTSEGTTYIH